MPDFFSGNARPELSDRLPRSIVLGEIGHIDRYDPAQPGGLTGLFEHPAPAKDRCVFYSPEMDNTVLGAGKVEYIMEERGE